MKKSCINKDNIIKICKILILVVLAGLIVYAFILSRTAPASVETEETVPDVPETPAPGDMITQKYGKSDSFFQSDGVILFDNGKGAVDITKYVKGWAFGLPLVSINDVPYFTELKLYFGRPEGAVIQGYEIYAEGEEPQDINERKRFFFLAPNNDYAIYQSNSSLVHGPDFSHEYMYKLEMTEDGDILISLDELPYFDATDFSVYNSLTPLYEDNKTTFILRPNKRKDDTKDNAGN